MTKKADFNADEWTKVVEGPMLAGMRVVTADRGGTIRESLAMGKVYAQARQDQEASELLDELVSSPPALDPQRMQGAGDIAAASTDRLKEAVVLLNEKGSAEEVAAYRQFVVAVARAAAEAHKEGSFIGIGGKQVSEKEQAALDGIGAALA
ncbi:MAG: hypothetical protein WKF29_10555 [Thermoleophilaceae bacterium]